MGEKGPQEAGGLRPLVSWNPPVVSTQIVGPLDGHRRAE